MLQRRGRRDLGGGERGRGGGWRGLGLGLGRVVGSGAGVDAASGSRYFWSPATSEKRSATIKCTETCEFVSLEKGDYDKVPPLKSID